MTPRAAPDDATSRRGFLRLAGVTALGFAGGGLTWAQNVEDVEDVVAPARAGARRPALISIRLGGGPSQLETFDPHPGGAIGGPTRGIATRLPGVQLADGYPRLAERLDRLALVRSVVTTEGEHERGRYLLRTGQVLIPTARYPALTAVVAHDALAPGLEVPRHVSLLEPDPPRGGVLGPTWDAFAVGDPRAPLQDLSSPVGLERLDARLAALDALESGFRRGREQRCRDLQHEELARRGRVMMASPQVKAFGLEGEPAATLDAYGDTPFGRACLVARRLVETGVPAVEVTLDGFDTHASNFEGHAEQARALDPALSALLDDLESRALLRGTDAHPGVVLFVSGEFGRTPRINALEGRDHWTRGFSVLLAGRGLRRGLVLGSTDPEGEKDPADPVSPMDLFATLHQVLGIDRERSFTTSAGRPVKLNEGAPIARLLA